MALNYGSTFFPNNILNQLATDKDINKCEYRVILLICRLTFGMHHRFTELKKVDFAACGIDRRNINKILKSLIEKKWLFVSEIPNQPLLYCISQKRYEQYTKQANPILSRLIHNGAIKFKKKKKCHYKNDRLLLTIGNLKKFTTI